MRDRISEGRRESLVCDDLAVVVVVVVVEAVFVMCFGCKEGGKVSKRSGQGETRGSKRKSMKGLKGKGRKERCGKGGEKKKTRRSV